MKKSFLLLPITLAVLTACSSDSPAPVESADGTLSPGMMQPVDSPSMGGMRHGNRKFNKVAYPTV